MTDSLNVNSALHAHGLAVAELGREAYHPALTLDLLPIPFP